MTAMNQRRALARASAYLRINHVSKHAEVVNGAQVDFVLTEVYSDQQVKQQPGGGFIVTTDDWTPIQYVPLADNQDLRQLADAYKHWAAPGDGKQFHRRAPGTCYITRLGEIAHLDGGRIRNQFKPLTAADMAQAA